MERETEPQTLTLTVYCADQCGNPKNCLYPHSGTSNDPDELKRLFRNDHTLIRFKNKAIWSIRSCMRKHHNRSGCISVLFVTCPTGVRIKKYIEIYIVKLLLFILTDDSIRSSTLRTRDRKDKNPVGPGRNIQTTFYETRYFYELQTVFSGNQRLCRTGNPKGGLQRPLP